MERIAEQKYSLATIIKLQATYTRKQYMLSGMFGGVVHVLFDSPLYYDIKPFFPFDFNPLYGIVSHPVMYLFCFVLLLPAFFIYFIR